MVIEFLTAKGSGPIEIRRRLRSGCGEDAIDVNLDAGTVVLKRCKKKKYIGDRTRSGRPTTAATTEMKAKVDAPTRDCRRMTSGLCAAIGSGKLALVAIIRELDDRKVCARWVPKMLTVELETAQKEHPWRTPVQ
jgi:hypothetical protein